jgi:hypothetical protein
MPCERLGCTNTTGPTQERIYLYCSTCYLEFHEKCAPPGSGGQNGSCPSCGQELETRAGEPEAQSKIEAKRTGYQEPSSRLAKFDSSAAKCASPRCRFTSPPQYDVRYVSCTNCQNIFHSACTSLSDKCFSCGEKTLIKVAENKKINEAQKKLKNSRIEYAPTPQGSLSGGTPVWIDCHGTDSSEETFVPENMKVTIYGKIGEAMTFSRGVDLLYGGGDGAEYRSFVAGSSIPNFGVSELTATEQQLVARVAAGKRVLWVGRNFEAASLCTGGRDCGRVSSYLDDEYGSDEPESAPKSHGPGCSGLFKAVEELFAEGEQIDLHFLMCLGSGDDTTALTQDDEAADKQIEEWTSDSQWELGDREQPVEPYTPRTEWRRRADQFYDLVREDPEQAMWAWWRFPSLSQAKVSGSKPLTEWYQKYEDTLDFYQPLFDTEQARTDALRSASAHLQSAYSIISESRQKRKEKLISATVFRGYWALVRAAIGLCKKCESCADSYGTWRDDFIRGDGKAPGELVTAREWAENLRLAAAAFTSESPEDPFGPWLRDLAEAVTAELNQFLEVGWTPTNSPAFRPWT